MDYKTGVTKEEYIKMPGLSRSGIVKLIEGPSSYKYYIDNPVETKSMKLGTAIHDFLLAPEYFKANYIAAPEGMKFNTKEGIEFKKLHSEKLVLNFKHAKFLEDVKIELSKKNTFAEIMSDAILEPCAQWEENGVTLKTMPDIVNFKKGIIADIKSIGQFSESKIQYAIRDYGLDIQGAMALEAFPLKDFILIFISTKYPIRIQFKKVRQEDLVAAKIKYEEQLPIYKKCMETNVWPSNDLDEILNVDIPMGDREYKDEDYYNEEF